MKGEIADLQSLLAENGLEDSSLNRYAGTSDNEIDLFHYKLRKIHHFPHLKKKSTTLGAKHLKREE